MPPRKSTKEKKADCKVKTKDDTKDLKKTSKDETDEHAEEVDFSKEEVGHYSNAHLLFKLRRIRDNSINHVDQCATVQKWKGLGAAEQAFEMSMNNIERIEQKDRNPQGGTAIKIEIPGFDPSQIKFGPSSPPDDAEKPKQ